MAMDEQDMILLRESCRGNKQGPVLNPYDVISPEEARAFLSEEENYPAL